eukprot:1667573-Pleurochrysis_carterae.AAC.2
MDCAAVYDDLPPARLEYPELVDEIFVEGYFLRNLCNVERFPDWPVFDPPALLQARAMSPPEAKPDEKRPVNKEGQGANGPPWERENAELSSSSVELFTDYAAHEGASVWWKHLHAMWRSLQEGMKRGGVDALKFERKEQVRQRAVWIGLGGGGGLQVWSATL